MIKELLLLFTPLLASLINKPPLPLPPQADDGWVGVSTPEAGWAVGGWEEEEFIQNRTRARRDSQRDGTNTLSRNAGFNQSADEVRTRPHGACRPPATTFSAWILMVQGVQQAW